MRTVTLTTNRSVRSVGKFVFSSVNLDSSVLRTGPFRPDKWSTGDDGAADPEKSDGYRESYTRLKSRKTTSCRIRNDSLARWCLYE